MMKLHLAVLAGLIIPLCACGAETESTEVTPAPQPAAQSAPAPDAVVNPATPPAAADDESVAVAESDAIDETVDADKSSTLLLAQANIVKPSAPSQFKEGQHYKRLTPTQPTSSSPEQVEVAEVFWYGCSHCYDFDPRVENWKKQQPDNVNFVRIPAMWNPLLQLHARAFYTADILGISDKIHTPLFREIHVNRNPLNTPELLATFFSDYGVDKTTFDENFNSFAVHTRLQRADQLNRRYRINSVPVIIINGKYSSDARSAEGYDSLLGLVDELVGKESNRN